MDEEATIGLVPGTYAENVTIDAASADVRIRGRCADGTVVVAQDDEAPTLLVADIRPHTITVEHITFRGGLGIGTYGGRIDAVNIVVEATAGLGMLVAGGRASLSVADSTIRAGADTEGSVGSYAGEGASLRLQRVRFDGAGAFGVRAKDPGTTVFLDDVEIRASGIADSLSAAVWISDNASITANRLTVAAALGSGIVISNGATGELEDVLVTGMRAQDRMSNAALGVYLDANVSVRSVTIRGAEGAAIAVTAAEVAIDGCSVASVLASAGTASSAVLVSAGSSVHLTGCHLYDLDGTGVYVAGIDADVVVADSIIEAGTAAPVSAVAAFDGASVAVVDSVLDHGGGVGLYALNALSVTVRDTEVRRVRPDVEPAMRVGVSVAGPTSTQLERVVVVGATGAGIAAFYGAAVTLHDVVVANALPYADDDGGKGIVAASAATIVGDRVRVSDVTTAGVSVEDALSSITLENCVVERTNRLPDGRFGRGVNAQAGGRLALSNCIVRDSVEGGLHLSDGASATLYDVLVTGTSPGPSSAVAQGVQVQLGAVLDATRLRAAGNDGPGLAVVRAEVVCRECEFNDNAFAGVANNAGTLVLTDSAISRTRASASAAGGVGVWIEGSTTATTATVLTRVVIGTMPVAGLWAEEAGTAVLDAVDIAPATGFALRPEFAVHGNGIFARGASTTLDVRSATIATDTAPAILLDGANASLSGVVTSGGGVPLWQQGCATGRVTALPDAVLCPADELLTLALTYSVQLAEPVASRW